MAGQRFIGRAAEKGRGDSAAGALLQRVQACGELLPLLRAMQQLEGVGRAVGKIQRGVDRPVGADDAGEDPRRPWPTGLGRCAPRDAEGMRSSAARTRLATADQDRA